MATNSTHLGSKILMRRDPGGLDPIRKHRGGGKGRRCQEGQCTANTAGAPTCTDLSESLLFVILRDPQQPGQWAFSSCFIDGGPERLGDMPVVAQGK